MKDVMLSSYITIALRTLRKRPGYTIIHVLGLAVGLAACLLIGRYVVHAWSYDRFHADADAIHRVTQTRQFGTVQRTAVTPPPLAPALQASFPAVENTVRLVRQSMTVEQGGDAFRGQTVVTADSSFFGLFSFPLQQGRAADVLAAPYSIVLTASAAARYFGTTETVFTGDTAWRVVGVVDDFHYNALYSTVDPLLIRARPEALRQVLVRTAPGQAEQAFAALAAGWQAVVADRPLDLASVRDQRAQLYQTDRRLGQLVGLLAGLTVFIACLGLFGLAAHTTAQRTKEIGVRKVLGATVPKVVALLSADVLKLIGIALVLAVPLAYIALQHWLADFAYRTDLSAGAFLVAGALALTVALLTVSTQTIRAATADPVNALRSA